MSKSAASICLESLEVIYVWADSPRAVAIAGHCIAVGVKHLS